MTVDATQGRRAHYGEFYGLRPLPVFDGRALLMVHGNCQGEALRVLIEATGRYRTVRIPPVHEIEDDDLPHLDRTLAAVGVLVTQPVKDGYRGLPVGTSEVAGALPDGAVVVRIPAIRYAGLFPFQVLVRAPPLGDPPVVPYHDLRTMVQAATGARPASGAPADAYREIERSSVAELRRREQAGGIVAVFDLLHRAGVAAAHTVNHPGNPVLRGLAERVLERLGHQVEVPDPGRTLLDAVHTPLAADVLDALGLPGPARDTWVVAGVEVGDDEVRDEQLRWYATHDHVAPAGLRRHRDAAARLGLL